MSRDLVQDIASYLESLDLAHRTKGMEDWWIVIALQDDPACQVAIIVQPGGEPIRSFDRGASMERPVVQLLFLGNPMDYFGSRAQADAVYEAMRDLREVTLGSNLYQSVTAQQSGPIWLGFRESDNRPQWSVNLSLQWDAG